MKKSPLLSQTRMFPFAEALVSRALAVLLLLGSAALAQNPFESRTPAGVPSPVTTDREGVDDGEDEQSAIDKLIAAETDPLVLAIVEARPTTPLQWMNDIRALVNLRRLELAKAYLKEFLTALPDDAEQARLQSRFGTAFFLRLSNLPELQPEGAAAARSILQAADDRLRDNARLAGLVDQLSDPQRSARRAALKGLVEAGPAAAVPLISVLADPNRSAEHAAVRSALVALGEDSVQPLLATLNSGKVPLMKQAIMTLSQLESRRAVPYVLRLALAPGQDPELSEAARQMLNNVLGAVPSRDEAISFLSRRLDQYLAGAVPGPTDENDQVTLWIWDPTQQLPRTETLDVHDATFLTAALLADELYRLDPSDPQSQQVYLATALEAAKRINGYGRPITQEMGAVFDEVRAADTQLLQGVLQWALDNELPGAAVAVIDVLAQAGDKDLLRSDDGQPRLLVAALLSPLPRVKPAAARAIMSIDPTTAYAGSSHLPQVLGYLSATGGRRRVLIGHPRRETAQELAGYFRVLGFQVDTRQRGRDVVLRAATNPDYAFVLLHDSIDRPAYRELIQELRRDPRTADLPVGLITRAENEQSARWFANTDALTMDLAPPQSQSDLATDTRRLLALAGRGLVTPDERISDALFALDALAQLAEDEQQYSFYDLLPLDQRLEKALNTPELTAKAAAVLGLLGTPRAQQALVNLANNHVRSIAQRQAAAAAFREAVSRRGLLLTRDQLLRQYEIYNASEFLDQETQTVLASILDTIEGPSRAGASATSDD